ncbi:MAG: hypothetical protein QGI09_11780 [Dehalococcoidia bacterium]|jgi:hypothetical protein|nr:hypothetical protein [Dehalococcoidia bacterium]
MNTLDWTGDRLSSPREYVIGRRVEIDLHGYSLATAEGVALAKVREAYENGFRLITFIHGWSTSRQTNRSEGRDTIRELLRAMLGRGEFGPHAYSGKHRKHIRDVASLTVALRPNHQPLEASLWSAMPPREYPR